MRHPLAKIATFALVAPLSGAMFLSAPAVAAPVAAKPAAVKAADPFSVFDISLKATKKVKRGGTINYSVVATNEGPYEATAGTWFVGGEFPKGVDLRKVSYRSSVAGTECLLDGRSLFCVIPATVKKDEYVAVSFAAKVKKTAKGTQSAVLGVVSYDVQQGMENMSKEELDRIGVPAKAYAKLVKTKIVR